MAGVLRNFRQIGIQLFIVFQFVFVYRPGGDESGTVLGGAGFYIAEILRRSGGKMCFGFHGKFLSDKSC